MLGFGAPDQPVINPDLFHEVCTMGNYAASDQNLPINLVAAGCSAGVARVDTVEPSDSGQFGVSFRYFAENLNSSEFGIYYVNYHSRVPYLGGFSSRNPAVPSEVIPPGFPDPLPPFIPLSNGQDLGALLGGGNPQYFAEFPEDIEMYGLSFATNFAGFAVSGEVSYRPDFPVQINTTEILQGAVGLAPWSTVTPIILEDAAINGWGNAISGFDRLPVTQAQITFIRFFDQVMGASRLAFYSGAISHQCPMSRPTPLRR